MIKNIIVVKRPNTAETPAASSSFAMPKKAGIIITQKMNQMTLKITPFFLVKIELLFLLSSDSCGKNPPFASSSETRPS